MYIQQYTKTIAEPFARAAVLTADAITYGIETAVVDAVRLYRALTSERAIAVYETLWLLCQLAFWLTVLAAEYTVKAGRAFRRYYQAEWATDVAWLIHQVWPQDSAADEPVETAVKLIQEAQAMIATPVKVEAKVMPIPEPGAEATDATPAPAIPDYQTMTSPALRRVCSDKDIRWRNAHGKGKHLKKAEMLEALTSRD